MKSKEDETVEVTTGGGDDIGSVDPANGSSSAEISASFVSSPLATLAVISPAAEAEESAGKAATSLLIWFSYFLANDFLGLVAGGLSAPLEETEKVSMFFGAGGGGGGATLFFATGAAFAADAAAADFSFFFPFFAPAAFGGGIMFSLFLSFARSRAASCFRSNFFSRAACATSCLKCHLLRRVPQSAGQVRDSSREMYQYFVVIDHPSFLTSMARPIIKSNSASKPSSLLRKFKTRGTREKRTKLVYCKQK